MDLNPYQSPRSDEQADAVAGTEPPQRSWARIVIGICCVGISLSLFAISFTMPRDLPGRMPLLLFMGIIASSFAAMGAGMFLRRDKLALCGLAILGLLIMVIVAAALRRV